MINLLPINKKVRETLVRRENAVSRVDSRGASVLDPVEAKNVASQENMKALWVKMFSSVIIGADKEKKIGGELYKARLYGGEVYRENESYFENAGYDDVYGTRRFQGRNVDTNESVSKGTKNSLNRPLPGILDFTCQYKGGLFAIREATINWIAWDLEDLERLIPHFASPGKGVLLEWGYESSFKQSVADTIAEEDMKNGKAYTRINEMVLNSGGTYDGIAGVISNFEWSLRDDGGFDVQTTIVSRGVNVLSKQLEQADAPLAQSVKKEDGTETNKIEVSPTLGEFVTAMKEQIIILSVGGLGPLGGQGDVSREPSTWFSQDWQPGSGKQPPGVGYFRGDSLFNTEKNIGPYVTWGWFEDNVLNKWCAKITEDGKITNQFRSIEPIPAFEGDGSFLKIGGGSTNNIEEAQFRSVIIGNNDYLITPHLDRWVLPGQFPFNKEINPLEDDGTFKKNTFNLQRKEMTAKVAHMINEGGYYHQFPVFRENKGAGGYLRNIMLSTNLIETAFVEAKTLQQGLQKLFDEINRDVNGFWSFQVVNDPFIPGNIKVIDTKAVLKEPSDYVSEANEGLKNNIPKEDIEMFIFDTWGERSIVKSQNLSVKLPSSFAVTAMYAGISNPKSNNSQGDGDAVAAGDLHSADSTDSSQKNIYEPNKLFDSFGSINPSIYDGAGSPEKGKNIHFGSKKGHAFDKLNWTEIIKKYSNEADKKEAKENEKTLKEKQASREPICIENFVTEFQSKKKLYDIYGNLLEDIDKEIVYKRVMNNILSGTVDFATVDNKTKIKIKKNRGTTDLLPIECEISLQGIGGIFPGNLFHVSYIPQRYRNTTLFQALSVDHSVSEGSWETRIKGQVRIATDTLYDVIETKKFQILNPTIATKDIPFVTEDDESLEVSRDSSTPRIDANTFEEAFRKARANLGPNKAFIWNNNLYVTRYEEEGYEGTAGLQSSGDYTNNVNFRSET